LTIISSFPRHDKENQKFACVTENAITDLSDEIQEIVSIANDWSQI
jgi:hypothetical protein